MDGMNNAWSTASQEMYSQAQGGQEQQAQPAGDDGIQDVEYEEVQA